MFIYYAAISCHNILSHIKQNIPQSNRNNGKDIWSQNWSVCHLCLPTANPTPAKGRQTAFSSTVLWQLPKIKIGQIAHRKKIGGVQEKFEAYGHCRTYSYHSLFDKKMLFFYLLCSISPVPMPLIEISRSNVTIACCRMKIFLMIRP